MNLFKVYSALVILLVLCTYDAEGGIILLLLLKIIALKGALFFGMPLAIGSFMMGQGMGFFGGSLFGGYSMLNAAHKYQKSQALKLKGHHYHHHKPIVTYGPPSHGWGWADKEYSVPDVAHFHHYGHGHSGHKYYASHSHVHSQPSLLSKISRIPSVIADRFRRKRPVTVTAGPVLTSYKTPLASSYGGHSDDHYHGSSSHSDDYHGQNPMNTYYDDTPVGTGDKYSENSHSDNVDWNQGLANLLKAAEVANSLPSSPAYGSPSDDGGSYSSGYPSSSSSSSGYHQPSSTYEDPSPGKYESSASVYDLAPPPSSDTSSNSAYAYGAPDSSSSHQQEPGQQYSYSVNHPALFQQQQQHQQPSQYEQASQYEQESSYVNSPYATYGSPAVGPAVGAGVGGYDGEGQESEESYKKVRAPNSIIEKYLEKKLKDEMEKQKSEAQRKEAAQLITMLRQVYIQELVDSLNPQGRKSRTTGQVTTELPGFIPFPVDVPNSTTAKPKTAIKLSSLSLTSTTPTGKAAVDDDDGAESTTKHVRIRSTTAPTLTTSTPAPLTNARISHLYTRQRNPFFAKQTSTSSPVSPASTSSNSNNKHGSAEPTRFVRMKTSFVLNKRRMGMDRRNPAAVGPAATVARRNRRQNSAMDLQALTTFTDDIKKFFLLVSILDQDKCLQKLVCDVHTRSDKDNLTPYETNIVITFKVMNAMIPMETEDSTTNYRKASKIGELSKSAQVCVKAYPSCSYSPTEIIGMGNLVAATGSVDSVTTTKPVVLPTPSTSADQDAAGSETNEQVVARPSVVTAMPRV